MRPTIATQALSLLLWSRALAAFAVVASSFILLSLVLSPRRLQPATSTGCRWVLRAAGMRLRVVGEFPDLRAGPYIYIFNHTSMLDPMITVAAIPEHIGAIGKAEQFSMPLWGTLIRRWGAVPIQRSDLPNAIQSLDQVEAAIAGGLSLLISPEGTRSPDGSLLPFKKGPFHLAANTGVPMVPMAITGAFAAKQRGSWILRPATLTVQVGPPIWVGDAEDSTPEGLRDLAHRRLLAMLAPQA